MKDRSRIREKSEIECIIDFEALYFSTGNKKTNHKTCGDQNKAVTGNDIYIYKEKETKYD